MAHQRPGSLAALDSLCLPGENVVETFQRAASDAGDDTDYEFGDALFSLCLTLLVFGIAMVLAFLPRLRVANVRFRELAMDYALPVGVLVAVGISYVPNGPNVREIDGDDLCGHL